MDRAISFLVKRARQRLCFPRRFQLLWILGSPGYKSRKLPKPLPYYTARLVAFLNIEQGRGGMHEGGRGSSHEIKDAPGFP